MTTCSRPNAPFVTKVNPILIRALTCLVLTVLLPFKAYAKPYLVFVHGGAWVSGRASDYDELGEKLRSRGYCFKAIDYRLAPAVKHPDQVADLNRAITDLKKEKTADCDPTQIVLLGHSAGAHMIAFWASEHREASIKGFVGIEGIYDIPALVKKWPSYKDQFIQSEFGAPKNWEAASPKNRKLKTQAPWLVLHSKDDELVELEQSAGFEKSLKAQKIRVEYVQLAGATHFGVVESLKEKTSPASLSLERFLKTLKP